MLKNIITQKLERPTSDKVSLSAAKNPGRTFTDLNYTSNATRFEILRASESEVEAAIIACLRNFARCGREMRSLGNLRGDQ